MSKKKKISLDVVGMMVQCKLNQGLDLNALTYLSMALSSDKDKENFINNVTGVNLNQCSAMSAELKRAQKLVFKMNKQIYCLQFIQILSPISEKTLEFFLMANQHIGINMPTLRRVIKRKNFPANKCFCLTRDGVFAHIDKKSIEATSKISYNQKTQNFVLLCSKY